MSKSKGAFHNSGAYQLKFIRGFFFLSILFIRQLEHASPVVYHHCTDGLNCLKSDNLNDDLPKNGIGISFLKKIARERSGTMDTTGLFILEVSGSVI